MSNSLIQAAQKMYSAKYAEAQKDITPIAKGVSYLGANITKALDEKLEEQEKKAAKTTETFKDILLKSEKARPELTSQITKLQDEYFENIKISEGIFRNKEERQKAVDRNNQIANELKAWEDDLRSQDLNASLAGTVSDFEGDAGKAAKLGYVDKDILANNIVYKRGPNAGVYTKTLDKDGNIVEKRLSEWEPPIGKFQAGIDTMIDTQQASVKAGSTGLDWNSYVLPDLSNNLSKLMDNNNFGSLLFDNIGDFNWATQQMAQEFPDANLSDPEVYKTKRQELREMVKNGVDKNKKPFDWKKEFKDDVLRAYKMDYDDAVAKQALKEIDKNNRGRQRTPLSELQLLKINTFINSVNRGGDIQFPNGDIGKKENGRIQLYMDNGKKYDGIPPMSIDEAMDRANIPVDMRSKVLSGSTSSSAVLAGENPSQPKTAEDLIKLYSNKK